MSKSAAHPTVASLTLAAVLAEDSWMARQIRNRFDAGTLHRLREGQRVPTLRTVVELEKLSRKRIAV